MTHHDFEVSFEHIRSVFEQHSPIRVSANPQTRQAAVAIILRRHPQRDVTQILFIKRAEKRGDPWSGHMAFPGGHREPQDADLAGTAQRETLEEIGLDLERFGHQLGAVDEQHAAPRGLTLDMLIAPYVFELTQTPPLELNYEVQAVVWTDLISLVENGYHDTQTMPMPDRPMLFNGFRLPEGHFVWGLTYRMLKSFFATLYPHWREADID